MKKLGMALVALIALSAVVLAIDYQQARGIRSFCNQIAPAMPIGDVLGSAGSAGFPVLKDATVTGSLAVLNHKPFFFRYACNISFADGKVTGAKFMAAD